MKRNPVIDDLLMQARRLIGLAARDRVVVQEMAPVSQRYPAQLVRDSTRQSSGPHSQERNVKIAVPLVPNAGERLYLLNSGKLYEWATNHWRSLSEMEAVCDAYRHNWRIWRQQHPNEWSVAERFFSCEERLADLRQDAWQELSVSEGDDCEVAREDDLGVESAGEDNESCVGYARSVEAVLIAWEDRHKLLVVADDFRQSIPGWMQALPAELCPRRALELIEMRLHALLASPRTHAGSRNKKAKRLSQRSGRPQGVPEWPHEAKAPQSVALAGNQFSYPRGVLSYMGYRVGKVSALTAERRHRILAYVLLGDLPQVNDRQYMRTWGRPKSAFRLRKLSNALAAFARNARRKDSNSFGRAIAGWEQDLTYLKKRYYDCRRREWKWPETRSRRR